jgi:hypothetical protein
MNARRFLPSLRPVRMNLTNVENCPQIAHAR